MSDLISREDAIRAMLRLECDDIETYGAKIPEGFDAEPAVEALKALPTAQPDLQPTCNQLATDCISRQAAIDAIAKFVPHAICDESTESYTNGLTDAFNLICQLPSAQPEQEIVRCKDCKHYWQVEGRCAYGTVERFRMASADPDGFCSCGEWRDDVETRTR